MKKKTKKKNRLTRLVVGLVVLSLFAVGGYWGAMKAYQYVQAPLVTYSDPILFTVTPGSRIQQVADQLAEEGIVRSSFVVQWVARQNKLTAVKAGSFILNRNWDVLSILETLNDPRAPITNEVRITFPEGDWAKDFARKLGNLTSVTQEELLDLWNNEVFLDEMIERYDFLTEEILNPLTRVRLEGYLFPETYNFFVSTSARAITLRLLDQTNKIYQRNKSLFENHDYSVHEIFILASIVEYEAQKTADMKLVAGVLFNRLAINMPLQVSPSICYALYEFDSWRDCERNPNIESPYNTYKYRGLPVGPILNPSERALLAVLEPTPSKYYYFMADVYGDKTIYFAETYAQHQANVNKYLKGR